MWHQNADNLLLAGWTQEYPHLPVGGWISGFKEPQICQEKKINFLGFHLSQRQCQLGSEYLLNPSSSNPIPVFKFPQGHRFLRIWIPYFSILEAIYWEEQEPLLPEFVNNRPRKRSREISPLHQVLDSQTCARHMWALRHCAGGPDPNFGVIGSCSGIYLQKTWHHHPRLASPSTSTYGQSLLSITDWQIDYETRITNPRATISTAINGA